MFWEVPEYDPRRRHLVERLPQAQDARRVALAPVVSRGLVVTVEIRHSKMELLLPAEPENSFDACICDPPYHLTALSRNGSARFQRSCQTVRHGALGPWAGCSSGSSPA